MRLLKIGMAALVTVLAICAVGWLCKLVELAYRADTERSS